MSSLRVRAQNKLLNKLGAAKPSKNVQFDTAHANFEKTQASVTALDAALRGFIVSLKGFHISAQVLYGAIEAMGGTPENSPEMKQTVGELKNAFMHVDVNALNDSVKRFENRVLRPTSGWMGRAASLKHQISEFNEEKLAYDHYTRKVMGLRESRDKRASSGKSEKPKDVEKLVRNEQKLAAKTNSYAKNSESTVANLREFVNTREATLTPIVQRVLEFRVQYATRIAEESKLFQKLVRNDSVFDGVLGSLEKFVIQFTGVGPDKTQDDSDSHYAPVVAAAEPEPPVQALSFESFVGEAPPHQSGRTDSRTASHGGWGSEMPALPQPNQSFATGPHSFATAPTPVPLHSPSSPSSGNAFFDDFASMPPPPPPPIQAMASAAFHTAPVQPLSPSSAANFTPWDDIPPPPPPQPKLASMNAMAPQFNTMPASPTAPAANGWDAFGDLGSTNNFQAMHQNAMH